MLSPASPSPSSLLLSTAHTALTGASPLGGGQAESGFAEFLNAVPAPAGTLGKTSLPGQGPAVEAASAKPAAGTAAAVERPVEPAATVATPANAVGKILPLALPEAAAPESRAKPSKRNDDAPAHGLGTDTAATQVDLVGSIVVASAPGPDLVAPLPAAAPTAPVSPPRHAGKGVDLKATPSSPEQAPVRAPAAVRVSAAPQPEHAAHAVSSENRPTALRQEALSTSSKEAGSELSDLAAAGPLAVSPPKPARRTDPARSEVGSLPRQESSANVTNAQPDVVSTAPATPIASAPAHVPSPTDINAALDRLVAAREALMPVEAALAVEHAEFGKVSIRFEQAPDGRLSAELSAADPELQRAVNAAVAADRGPTAGSEGDHGRAMAQASQRGVAADGGDTAAGGRGQSDRERDFHQRGAPGRSSAPDTPDESRPGVFA